MVSAQPTAASGGSPLFAQTQDRSASDLKIRPSRARQLFAVIRAYSPSHSTCDSKSYGGAWQTGGFAGEWSAKASASRMQSASVVHSPAAGLADSDSQSLSSCPAQMRY